MATKSKKNVKSSAKKAAKPAAKVMKIVPVTGDKPRSKGQTLTEIAEHTGLSRKQVAGVFETMTTIIGLDLTKGSGIFKVPNLMKITVVRKPAVKGGGMKKNPFTGEMMEVKPKPARNVVRIRPLANLKGMV